MANLPQNVGVDLDRSQQNWWLAIGTPENWQTAFGFGNIWGLKGTPRHTTLWERISPGDQILFYATSPVGGIIGHGTIRNKFKQNKPLWPEEVKKNQVIWPNRFEFDVIYCLPQDRWRTNRISSKLLKTLSRGGFQSIPEKLALEIIASFQKPEEEPLEARKPSLHEEIKQKLLEIGRLQKYLAEKEYGIDGARLDVVWRRVERAVPAYVFEVQVGGNLTEALTKLKHAYDLWNCNLFLILREEDLPKAKELLSGAFHEVQEKVKLITINQVEELFRKKKAYRDFERELGIP